LVKSQRRGKTNFQKYFAQSPHSTQFSQL
jgi:hypothetical protein